MPVGVRPLKYRRPLRVSWAKVLLNEIPFGFFRGGGGPSLSITALASGDTKPECIADNDLRPYFVRIAQIETAFIQEPFYPLLEKPILTFRSERLALCW